MSKKQMYYLGFFVLLAVGFYFALSALIPGYAKGGVAPVSYVRPFSFTNQDGKTVTEKDVKGKVYVANFFFTTCKTVCPIMNNYLVGVYDKYKDEKDFLILSHSSMPDVDSVPLMKKYADSLKVNTAKWIFLTGKKNELYNAARISYTIDDPNNNLVKIDDDFMHTQFCALVDKNGNVRGVYDGLKKNEIDNLIKDIGKYLKD
jgi:protein SCO1